MSGTASNSTSSAATAGTTGSAATGGVLVEDVCRVLCADASTDADDSGMTDGWGFEAGQSCVVPGGMADTGAACSDPVLVEGPANPSAPGTGVLINGACTRVCEDASTDADPETGAVDGWGYERGVSCVVSGSPADPGIEQACTDVPGNAASTPGGMVDVDGTCYPVCMDDSTDPDHSGMTDGWGYENEASCIVPGGIADTGMSCA